jgi:hypothetical protein
MKVSLLVTQKHRAKIKSLTAALLILSILCVVLILVFAQRQVTTNQRARPRRVSDQTPAALSSSVLRVGPSGDLQRILNSAKCGDTIVLEAGATYTPKGDGFQLPAKPNCTGTDKDFITIQTSNLAGIPLPNQRINPSIHAAAMPKLVGTNGAFVISAAVGAHHYKLIGIEVTTTGQKYTSDLVNLGSYFTREQRLSTNHFVFDRMFFHSPEVTTGNLVPTTVERSVGRGLALGVADVSLTNSYVAGFCGKYPASTGAAGQNIDSYGVYSDVGPGPIRIINNYIEAQFNNVFIGGAGMSTTNTATLSQPTLTSATFSNVTNLEVGDLVALAYSRCTAATGPNGYAKPWETGRVTSISGNRVNFLLVKAQNSCSPAAPDEGGMARWKGDLIRDVEILRNTLIKPDAWNAFSNPKAWIEIKLVKSAIIDGNDLYSGIGTTIALTVRNQDGSSPWGTIEDVQITNNRIRGYKWGFSLLMSDNEQPTVSGGNVTIRNNLFYEPRPAQGDAANFLQLVAGHDIVVEHNTIIQPGNPVVAEAVTSGFVFKDNIVANYQYGMQCTIQPNTLSACWPGIVMTGNVIIDTRWDKGDGPLSNRYPRGNYYVSSLKEIGFVDADNGDYRLSPSSRFRGTASDGQDPGCNISELMKALNGNQ